MDSRTAASEVAASTATVAAAQWASRTTQVGAWSTVASWMVSSEFGMLAGIFIGFVGLAINWYYRRKEYRLQLARSEREQAAHELLMRQQAGH